MSDCGCSSDCDDEEEDNDLLEGLTPELIQELSQKVFVLILGEMRIEQERHGVLAFGRGW